MKVTRNNDAGLVMFERLGAFGLGTLSVKKDGDKLSVFDTLKDEYILANRPFHLLRDKYGAAFVDAQSAFDYVQRSCAAQDTQDYVDLFETLLT